MSKREKRILMLMAIALLLVVAVIGLSIINQQTAGQAAQINSWLTANPPP